MTQTRLLKSSKSGRQVYYTANTEHSLFPELRSMVRKVMGIDQVIDGIVNRLGKVDRAYLIDDYAAGKDTGIIDVLLVGDIDHYHLTDLTRKTERYIKRKIRPLVLTAEEYESLSKKWVNQPHVLIWESEAAREADGVPAPSTVSPNRQE
jgi:hypothetical protein